jgi:hypothetical protein
LFLCMTSTITWMPPLSPTRRSLLVGTPYEFACATGKIVDSQSGEGIESHSSMNFAAQHCHLLTHLLQDGCQ